MDRDRIINELTRIDTADYRRRTNPLQHEPSRYRIELRNIYKNLNTKTLKRLLELKNDDRNNTY